MWLVPVSVVIRSFSLRPAPSADAPTEHISPSTMSTRNGVGDCGVDCLRDIASLAKSVAAGTLFSMCAADAVAVEPPIYLSHGGRAVMAHRDGIITLVREIDPEFRNQTQPVIGSRDVLDSLHPVGRFNRAARVCCRAVTFEPGFTGAPCCAWRSCPGRLPPSPCSNMKEDVRIRVHLPRQSSAWARAGGGGVGGGTLPKPDRRGGVPASVCTRPCHSRGA